MVSRLGFRRKPPQGHRLPAYSALSTLFPRTVTWRSYGLSLVPLSPPQAAECSTRNRETSRLLRARKPTNRRTTVSARTSHKNVAVSLKEWT